MKCYDCTICQAAPKSIKNDNCHVMFAPNGISFIENLMIRVRKNHDIFCSTTFSVPRRFEMFDGFKRRDKNNLELQNEHKETTIELKSNISFKVKYF